MSSFEPIRIVGAPGSPYSRKMRAVLRYRRIPYAWMNSGAPESRGLPQPRVALLPQLLLPRPDGEIEAVTDSTPLIRRLEQMYAGRAVCPDDPVLRFVDELIEDYADEWLTKAMFHYRWAYQPDIDKAAAILPRWFRSNMPEEQARSLGKEFAARQIARLGVVGSNQTTGPVIEASYKRLLGALDAHLTNHRFVFGGRPAAADFALYGQLTQLAGFDPTPAAVALALAPRVVAWIDLVEDLSGLEPQPNDWLDSAALPPTLANLLAEIGRTHVPFLLANAAALQSGAERVDCEIDGHPWVQKPFPYQGKCLQWLRQSHEDLPAAARRRVDDLLAGSGCERLW